LKDVTFTYMNRKNPVLKNINLELETGSVTAFVGQVGAGKSTLFRALNGTVPELLPGDLTGDVIIAGHNIKGLDTAQVAQYLNLVFDDPTLQIVSLVVEDDVAFGPANLHLPRKEIWERVHSCLERVGLKGYEKRDPRSLSGGEQQLVALAGILALRPRIMALDEPIAMLDPLGKTQVLDEIRELKDKYGATILIAESGTDIEPVCEFATNMVLMHQGEIIAQGPPGEVLANREAVEKSRMKLPSVTRVAYQLDGSMLKSVPTTLEGGKAMVRGMLGQHGARLSSSDVTAFTCPPLPGDVVKPQQGKGIVATHVHHIFPTDPPVHALKDVSLNIQKGDFVALLGQNGSGKSTLSFHLVGVEKPTNPEAEIHVGDLDVVHGSLKETVSHINYLFQNPSNQLFSSSFGEEVTFGPKALGMTPVEAEKRARAALQLVGLEKYWEYFTLSVDRAMETLLALASVLAMDPQYLIADEPTGGLDYATGEKVMEVLTELNKQGRTIIVITHDMELAVKYARRIIILRSGEVFMDGTPREIFCQPDKLAETRLWPPQITSLAQELAEYGYPNNVLSVEEFVGLTKAALAGKA
jgi:energy-coupling factor transport system ATP-binding protein